LKSEKAENTLKKLGKLKINQMKNFDTDYKQKEIKKIENINLSGWKY